MISEFQKNIKAVLERASDDVMRFLTHWNLEELDPLARVQLNKTAISCQLFPILIITNLYSM